MQGLKVAHYTNIAHGTGVCYDCDVLFSISLGQKRACVITIGALTAGIARRAILKEVEVIV